MAGVPPKKNTAYTFYTGLEDKANPGLFKASPTLANGDWKIAIDDGAPANLATLPVVDADFTKRVKVALSADEMNGDHITVIASDAAGAEWYDLQINIDTDSKQIGDLATQTSVDDVPTVAEFNARTLAAAAYFDPATDTVTPSGGSINSVSGTVGGVAGLTPATVASAVLDEAKGTHTGHIASIPTNPYTGTPPTPPSTADIKAALEADGSKLDHLWEMTEDNAGTRRLTADALELSPTSSGTGLTAQETANAVNNLAPVGTPAVGSIGSHLDLILNGLTGVGLLPLVYTVTVTDTAAPIEGVTVEVYTEEACINCIRRGTTNSFGVITFWFTTAGTYWLRREKDGVTFVNPDSEIVSA